MAGARVEQTTTDKLATMARAQGARTVGGRIPADPRPPRETAHIPGRVLRPQLPAGGRYVPAFSVAGPIEVRTYDMPLYNVTGGPVTITGVSAAVGDVPVGSAALVGVLHNGSLVAEVTIGDGENLGATVTGLSFTWQVDTDLIVYVNQVGATQPGGDLVVQVLTA